MGNKISRPTSRRPTPILRKSRTMYIIYYPFPDSFAACANYSDYTTLNFASTSLIKLHRLNASFTPFQCQAMVAIFDLDATQGDVQNAFVHSELDETVYCACPDGFRVPGMCIQLLKALYGLRRAPRLRFQNFVKKLNSLGFRQLSEEPCLFANDFMIIIFLWMTLFTLITQIIVSKLRRSNNP